MTVRSMFARRRAHEDADQHLAVSGLRIALTADTVEDFDARALSVRVQLEGGVGPVRLYVYLDGDLVDTWVPSAAGYEFRTTRVGDHRHTITVRAVDARGRSETASTIVNPRHRTTALA